LEKTFIFSKGGEWMPHIHNIIDDDHHFIIDPTTRAITSEVARHYIVQYDHGSEEYTFQIPRIVEGHDMSLSNRIEVHYTNITKNRRTQNDDVYIVREEDYSFDEDNFYFSWRIYNTATQLVGSLKFSITFLCHDETGNLVYEWGTALYEDIQVLAKNRNTAAVQEKYPDLYSQLEKEIKGVGVQVDELSVNAAFISESNEDIAIDTSDFAGTIHRFSVEVNCAPMYIPEDNLGPEFADGTDMYTDYGVLIFPKSYSHTGKKTRLVISAHGGGGTVSADSSQAEYQSISQYLVANGYAVMDVNGLPEQYAIDHGNLRLQDSVGSYIAIQSHIKAYNYAMDNFNFYPEVFLVGISEGGITTTNIVLHSHIPVLAQAGWSPVLDTYNQIWMDPWPWCSVNGPGAVLATVYGFDPIPGATSSKDRLKWTYDEKKIMGYNPMKCNVTTGADGLEYRHYRCPVKFWHCMDDETVRYEPTEAFIKSIQNAGGTAYLKLYETGGHETAYVGDPVPNPTGNTINLNGEEIEIKPVCEETYLFFKRFE
jgi:dipeptidyl aminopeptidase/acylaminoacyl peptidase